MYSFGSAPNSPRSLYFRTVGCLRRSLETTVRPSVCAAKLAALADPTRLAVLEFLLKHAGNLTEINRRVPVRQNLLSHHLSVLREAGLVLAPREGKAVRYELARRVQADSQGINLGCRSLVFARNVEQRTKFFERQHPSLTQSSLPAFQGLLSSCVHFGDDPRGCFIAKL